MSESPKLGPWGLGPNPTREQIAQRQEESYGLSFGCVLDLSLGCDMDGADTQKFSLSRVCQDSR